MSTKKHVIEPGTKFNRLTAIKETRKNDQGYWWLCRCDCGNEKETTATCLIIGNTKSCGCLRSEISKKRMSTHGLSKSREYESWLHMIKRCENQNDPSYKNEGGLGITVCDRWRASFADFIADMGSMRTPKHQIERKDNEKGYSPDNCCWATKMEQMANTRRNRKIEFRG